MPTAENCCTSRSLYLKLSSSFHRRLLSSGLLRLELLLQLQDLVLERPLLLVGQGLLQLLQLLLLVLVAAVVHRVLLDLVPRSVQNVLLGLVAGGILIARAGIHGLTLDPEVPLVHD